MMVVSVSNRLRRLKPSRMWAISSPRPRNDGVLRSGFAGKRGFTAQTISPTKPPLNQPLLDIEKGIPTYVSHSDFMKMLESAWCSKDCSDANILAVLKRTHIFVNTAKCLRIRPASETEGPVLRDKIDFLPVDSRKVYDYHRRAGRACHRTSRRRRTGKGTGLRKLWEVK